MTRNARSMTCLLFGLALANPATGQEPVVGPDLDRRDPVAMASVVVEAVGDDDLTRIVSLMPEQVQGQAAEIVEAGQANPQYEKFRQALGFDSMPTDAQASSEVRYDGSAARVAVGATDSGSQWIVQVDWDGAQWWFRGVSEIDQQEFLQGAASPTSSMLAAAIRTGEAGAVPHLLSLGASPAGEFNGGTVLMWAAREGHAEATQVLVDAGADVDAPGNSDVSPIMTAALAGSEGVFDVLLDAGASLADSNGRTLLLYACEGGSELIVRTLLTAGADLTSRGNQGMTAVMLAAREGHPAVVRALIEAGADVNANQGQGREEMTALHYGALDGSVETVSTLLDAGADANYGADEFSVLFAAVGSGRMEVLNLLLEAGARVDVTNDNGDTPLSMARQRNQPEMAARLQAAGAQEP